MSGGFRFRTQPDGIDFLIGLADTELAKVLGAYVDFATAELDLDLTVGGIPTELFNPPAPKEIADDMAKTTCVGRDVQWDWEEILAPHSKANP